MRRRAALITVVSLALPLLAVSACGGDSASTKPADQREAVTDAVKSYQSAAIDKDTGAYCALLSGDAKEEVIATTAPLGGVTDCEGSAKRIFDTAGKDDLAKVSQGRDALKPSDATVRGAAATVRLASGRTLRMSRTGDEWLVASVRLSR